LVTLLYLSANVAYLGALPITGSPDFESAVRGAQSGIEYLEKTGDSKEAKLEREKLDELLAQTSSYDRGIAYAPDDRVATSLMEQVVPGWGPTVMAIAIMISTFGCMNGLILSGARLTWAMAHDNLFFR